MNVTSESGVHRGGGRGPARRETGRGRRGAGAAAARTAAGARPSLGGSTARLVQFASATRSSSIPSAAYRCTSVGGRGALLLLLLLTLSSVWSPAAAANHLVVGSGSGSNGAVLSIPIALENADAVKAFQVDLRFDDGVAAFDSAAVAPRAEGMSLATNLLGDGTLRLVAWYDDLRVLAPGTGEVVALSFRVVGFEGEHTALTPSDAVLSGAQGENLPVSVLAGAITVTSASGRNRLAIGNGAGPSGELVRVALSLDNEDPVKGLQIDIGFDGAVVAFEEIMAAPRAGSMRFAESALGGDTLRVLAWFDGAGVLVAGDGAIAEIGFRLIGGGGTQSVLAPLAVLLSDPAGQPLGGTASGGLLEVTGQGTAPVLRLSVLKNPGRPRTLQVFVSSDQDLIAAPQVRVSGETLPVQPVAGEARLWLGALAAAEGMSSLEIVASGSNGTLTGEARTFVTWGEP